MPLTNLTDQEIVRRNKVKELEKLGVRPFGHRFDVTTHTDEIFRAFGDKTKEELQDLNINIRIAGRIVLKRGQGKAGFMHIQDRNGRIQIYVRTDSISELEAKVWKQSDLGDIIGVEGFLFRTNTGELSVHVTKYTHLSKALKPLPEKYHGLQDIEETRRKRYLDLITMTMQEELLTLDLKLFVLSNTSSTQEVRWSWNTSLTTNFRWCSAATIYYSS